MNWILWIHPVVFAALGIAGIIMLLCLGDDVKPPAAWALVATICLFVGLGGLLIKTAHEQGASDGKSKTAVTVPEAAAEPVHVEKPSPVEPNEPDAPAMPTPGGELNGITPTYANPGAAHDRRGHWETKYIPGPWVVQFQPWMPDGMQFPIVELPGHEENVWVDDK